MSKAVKSFFAASIAACVAAVFSPLFGDTWFDAGIPSYTSWPDDDNENAVHEMPLDPGVTTC